VVEAMVALVLADHKLLTGRNAGSRRFPHKDMMTAHITVPVALASKPYDVVIADRALDDAQRYLAPYRARRPPLLVSDEEVWAAQGRRLACGLGPVEAVPILVLGRGEQELGIAGDADRPPAGRGN
jgi:hypothetical protein